MPRTAAHCIREQKPPVGEGATATGKPTGAPRATGLDEARRINTGPQGTPERHAAGHNQGTQTGAKKRRAPGAANPGSAHNMHRTTAPEKVPSNTQPSEGPERTPAAPTERRARKATGTVGSAGPQARTPHRHSVGSGPWPQARRTGGRGRESAEPRTPLTEARDAPSRAPSFRPRYTQRQLARARAVE